MKNSINSGSHGHGHAFMALLLIGALVVSFLSASTAVAFASSGGGNSASGNAGGGYVGSGSSGGAPSPSGNGNENGGGAGSSGCRVINGPVKFVPTSTTIETQKVKVGSGNSNRPVNTYLIQERTVTAGEYQMTVYTTCACENTHHAEISSSTQVVGTDTRYSPWKTVSTTRE